MTVLDQRAPLIVEKVDENGGYLPGAKLALYDPKGNEVASWISGNGPEEIDITRPTFPDVDANPMPADNVGPVIYTLKELEAPEGYEKAEDVKFKLYPCGKWDYESGSEPSVPHDPLDPSAIKQGCDSASADDSADSSISEPCRSIVPETLETEPGTSRIKYSHIDPVRMVDDTSAAPEIEREENEFVIFKSDQYQTPLEEVPFEVYAKPTLSYEAEVKVRKNWEYEGASTITDQIGTERHAFVTTMYNLNSQAGGVLNNGEYSFPYSFMANLKAKATVTKNGQKETFTGSTLSELLGSDLTTGHAVEARNVNIEGREIGAAQYWYYEGAAEEELGTFRMKEGETVTIRETMEGSPAGRDLTVTGIINGQSVNLFTDYIRQDGFGRYNIFANKGYGQTPFTRIDKEYLTFFPELVSVENEYDTYLHNPFYDVFGEPYTSSNFVHHIAPGTIKLTFMNGELIRTDANGESQVIDNNEVVLTNVVQWRSEDQEGKCPPKWK